MNAPADLAQVIASQPDATMGYKSFTLGSFTFRRDEYFAHIEWTTRDGRPLSHTMDAGNYLRALMRDVAWGFFYGWVNFDHVIGTVNHYKTVDFFAGSFSFINADQFVALMKATAANAAGYAFQLAMSAMCETCMAAIETLQKKVQELNQYFGNSCQLAQGIVNDTAAAMGFQRGSSASLINTAGGVADVFGSWTSSDGENPEVKAANGHRATCRGRSD